MASQPVLNLPQPRTGWLGRVAGLFGGAPLAQPVADNPLVEASPAQEGAQPSFDIYSRAFGGFSIDPAWLNQLAVNGDRILTEESGGTADQLKLWDAVLDDDKTASSFQQRRMAVLARPWEVTPGDDTPRAKEAADHLGEQLKKIGWDRICDRMLYGIWYGYAVAEAMYKVGPDGKIWLSDVLVPNRAWFAFTNAGDLRLRTAENSDGEQLPPNKFWAFRCGGSHDFVPYGVGLAHWCYWPVWFKRNVVKFWAVYLEKFGMPTALGKFPDGADEDTRRNLLAAAGAVGRDSAVIIPETAGLELLASGRTGDGSYMQFVDSMNDALVQIILSQTGTSQSEAQGLGGSQSQVHMDVRDEVVQADSDLLHDSFGRTIAKWLTEWNFGADVATPVISRKLESEEDINTTADRDKTLYEMGIKRTQESVAETYGDGYVLGEPPAMAGALGGTGAQGGQPGTGADVIDLAAERAARRAQFAAMDPTPLYVSRKLLPESARALRAWATAQGIPNVEPIGEMHVTVLYSTTAVDWFDMGEAYGPVGGDVLTVGEGGPRAVSRFGPDEDTLVLQFASGALKWRHEEMIARGASEDYPDYRPHVTIAKGVPADFDASAVAPFVGELRFGPEIFERIKSDADLTDPALADAFASYQFAAGDLDVIDRFAQALTSEAEPLLAEFAAGLRGKTAGLKDVAALRVALLEGIEKFPAERLGELAALPMVAARAAAEAGIADKRLKA